MGKKILANGGQWSVGQLRWLLGLGIDKLGNCVELDVGGSLVDCSYFAITVVLLNGIVSGVSHTAHPVNALAGHSACYLDVREEF